MVLNFNTFESLPVKSLSAEITDLGFLAIWVYVSRSV